MNENETKRENTNYKLELGGQMSFVSQAKMKTEWANKSLNNKSQAHNTNI